MTPDDRAWLDKRIDKLEERIEEAHDAIADLRKEHARSREEILDRIVGLVPWRSLGAAIMIGVGIATLILTISGR
jgi:ElaB/YqjD/DUF883 family membrane-anchored ribosome-binding protein